MIWNDRIKQLRISHSMTLKDIARSLGVTEATAQRYESSAIKVIPYETIIKYATIFGCSPNYIMGWESDYNYDLSDSEKALIDSYRNAPESRREAVRALLELN